MLNKIIWQIYIVNKNSPSNWLIEYLRNNQNFDCFLLISLILQKAFVEFLFESWYVIIDLISKFKNLKIENSRAIRLSKLINLKKRDSFIKKLI